MSNHFTGLSLGPPLGDQRLDLCDLYAFQSPVDKNRTVIILNANPNADALHPDAIYRLNIDNDGDYLTDIAFSYVFSKSQNGTQTVNVFVATGSKARSESGPYNFFAGSRSDAFFFDFEGIKNLFDTRGKRNFTEPHLGKSPWTGVDSNTEANVFSTVIELARGTSVCVASPRRSPPIGDARVRPEQQAANAPVRGQLSAMEDRLPEIKFHLHGSPVHTGFTFWFSRNKFCGSYCRLISASRR